MTSPPPYARFPAGRAAVLAMRDATGRDLTRDDPSCGSHNFCQAPVDSSPHDGCPGRVGRHDLLARCCRSGPRPVLGPGPCRSQRKRQDVMRLQAPLALADALNHDSAVFAHLPDVRPHVD